MSLSQCLAVISVRWMRANSCCMRNQSRKYEALRKSWWNVIPASQTMGPQLTIILGMFRFFLWEQQMLWWQTLQPESGRRKHCYIRRKCRQVISINLTGMSTVREYKDRARTDLAVPILALCCAGCSSVHGQWSVVGQLACLNQK